MLGRRVSFEENSTTTKQYKTRKSKDFPSASKNDKEQKKGEKARDMI